MAEATASVMPFAPGRGWVFRQSPFRGAVVAAVIGVALSVLAWSVVAKRETSVAQRDFETNAADHVKALQSGIDEHLQKLVALRAFFDASTGGVSRDEFATFTRPLLDNREAILSFSWIPRISRVERAAHERAGAAGGIPGYHVKSVGPDGVIRPSPEADVYYPVFFANEPPGSVSYGINLQDGGVRQQAIDRAGDADALSATVNFRLQSGEGDRNGFFVALPVFERGMPHDTLAARRANLKGFVQGVFEFDMLVAATMGGLNAPFNIALFDAGAAAGDLPVHVRGAGGRALVRLPLSETFASSPRFSGDVAAGDRHWTMIVTSSVPATVELQKAWIVLCAGLLLTASVVTSMCGTIRHLRSLRTANAEMHRIARTDPLTGLANRRAFVEHLEVACAATPGLSPFAVHFIDLDEFKDINDTQGHGIGDALLVEVARRLSATVRPGDVVARFGGDEFAILQTGIGHPGEAGRLAQAIRAALAPPLCIGKVELQVTASIGIALNFNRIEAPMSTMIQADLALYRAKEDGRDCYRFHTAQLDQQVHLRVNLSEDLRLGIARGELELKYQTQVDIASGRIVGLEALVRWNHPVRGEIRPMIFVSIAERTGVIKALGSWVLNQACRQVREWEDEGLVVPRLGINVSGAQLRRTADFEHDVAATFARWGIRPDAIELELTETVLMEVSQRQSEALDRLRDLGASIAIDDFGTGYSSLNYLTIYPVQRLKIAQELVAGIATDKRSAVVVRSAVRLAHELGIESIAEGVETPEQARMLIEFGCAYAQGFHFSRPMAASDVARLLDSADLGDAYPVPSREVSAS